MKLQSEWKIFRCVTMYKKRWPHHLKSTPSRHQLTCICLICLYICHLLLRKHSHVSPAGFFLGWIWLKFDDKEEARKILEKIWLSDSSPHAKRRLSDLDLIGIRPGKIDDDEKFPRNAERNAKYVLEASQYKKKLAAIFETPQSKMAARIGACREYELERLRADLKRQKNLYRFIKRLSKFGMEKGGEFSRTEFERKFSDKSLGEIVGLLGQYREEARLLSPEFRYPSQWLDDLASKKKGIRFAESYVQALRKHIEIPKEFERTKGTGSDRI